LSSVLSLALRKEAISHGKVVSLTPGAVLEDEAFLIHLKGFYFFIFSTKKGKSRPSDFTDGRIPVLNPTLEVSRPHLWSRGPRLSPALLPKEALGMGSPWATLLRKMTSLVQSHQT